MTDSAEPVDILVEPDTTEWIVVPNRWPFAAAGSPADWAKSEARSRASDPGNRRWLRTALQRVADLTGDQEVIALYLPDPRSESMMLVRLQYALSDGDRDSTLLDYVTEGDGRSVQPPTVDEYESSGLGPGLRGLTLRQGSSGPDVLGVLAFAFRSGPYDLRISASDYDLTRLTRLTPKIEEFVGSIRLASTPATDPIAQSNAPVDRADDTSAPPVAPNSIGVLAIAEDASWLPVPTDMGSVTPAKRVKWARKTAGRVLPKRAMGILEPIGLEKVTVLLAAFAEITVPNEQWLLHKSTLPEEFVLIRIRWFRADEAAEFDLARYTNTDGENQRDPITVGPAEQVIGLTRSGPGSRAPMMRAPILRGPENAGGFVQAAVIDGYVVQIRFQTQRRLVQRALPDVERLIAAIRVTPTT